MRTTLHMRAAVFVLATTACLALAGTAWGHGEEITTNPERNAVLDQPPAVVTVTLTEAPTQDAVIIVTDGCNEKMRVGQMVSGKMLMAHLTPGVSGDYRVRWKVVSAVDGHPSDGAFSFKVRGKPDCSQPSDGDDTDATGGNGGDSVAGGGAGAAPASDEDDSSFPVVPVGLGILAVIGVALGARFAASR